MHLRAGRTECVWAARGVCGLRAECVGCTLRRLLLGQGGEMCKVIRNKYPVSHINCADAPLDPTLFPFPKSFGNWAQGGRWAGGGRLFHEAWLGAL